MTERKHSRKLQGQVAIITGGGRGIGAAAGEMLAAAGASVVLTARSEDQVEAAARQIRRAGAQAIAVPCDVTNPEQIEEVVEAALTQFDRVDILVNNAGIIWPVEQVYEADPEEWAYNIHCNLVGPFQMVRNVLPVMIGQEYGRIVNVSSGAAENVMPGWSAYCAAKAGLNMLTRCLASELQADGVPGVTVNALAPGMVDTEMQADVRSIDTHDSSLDFSRFHEAHLQGALLSTESAARLIYWLVGPWSRGRSGQIFSRSDAQWLEQVELDLA
ncbi:MAG: SDR family oxidoreductase [Caldilineaceae bacterium SB0670_bin_27]|uniref:SDR family oxidoreductase n=1 Tax=Caldilineaceae bacterium SB0664_bin_27 TaxID=2605260 RepID=A0A6B0YNW5_9CHLR|nr:SDR family oxidoreductase [Caldilineaceae bacterium SB0664_bin_27]MYJ78873.1 SDR family oxidoreductase [Caldilineaceae bacterium SB0670_bin_27]